MVDKKGEPTGARKLEERISAITKFFKGPQEFSAAVIDGVYDEILRSPVYNTAKERHEEVDLINGKTATQIVEDGTQESLLNKTQIYAEAKKREYNPTK